MHTKNIVLFALSAASAVASPFHRRNELGGHHRLHRTGSDGFRPTGTGRPFPSGNDTDGLFPPSGTASILPITMTVSPLPEASGPVPEQPNAFGNVVASTTSSCTTTSIATETSTNFVTVTASAAPKVQVGDVSAGAFFDQGRTRSGSWGQNPPPAASSAPGTAFPPAGNPSTTFASVPSASMSSAVGSASATSPVSPPSSGSGGKRGISFNDASLVKAFGNSVSWSYNWASTESGNLGGVEYVPMLWGTKDVSDFASKVGSATHVLGFNEPDLAEQANIDPQTAAKLHRQVMQDLFSKGVQVGSPAVTNGATDSPPMGAKWLEQFFEACGDGCPVNFVAYHWYATADSFDYFKQHTDDIVKVAQKYGVNKVWLTEFKPDGSADAQAAFMKEAVAYLDSNPAVERYAAFMASEGTMLSGGSLNTIGSAYAGA